MAIDPAELEAGDNMSDEELQAIVDNDSLAQDVASGVQAFHESLGLGAVEFGQNGYLIARSLTDAVGLSDPEKTETERGRFEGIRKRTLADITERTGSPKAAKAGETIGRFLPELIPAFKVGQVVGKVGSVLGAGANLGVKGQAVVGRATNLLGQGAAVEAQETGDITQAPLGAAKAAPFAAIPLLGQARKLRKPIAEKLRQLSGRQAVGKDPRPPEVQALGKEVDKVREAFRDPQSITDVLASSLTKVKEGAKDINDKVYDKVYKATAKVGGRIYDDLAVTFKRELSDISDKSNAGRIALKRLVTRLTGEKTTVKEAHKSLLNTSGEINWKDDVSTRMWAGIKASIKDKADEVKINGKGAGELLTAADDVFKKVTGPAKKLVEQVTKKLQKGAFDEATNLISSSPGNIQVFKALTNVMDDAGKKALEGGIVQQLIRKSTDLGRTDPLKFASHFSKLGKPFRAVFSKETKEQMDTIVDLTRQIKDHPRAGDVLPSRFGNLLGKLMDSKLGKAVLTKASKDKEAAKALVDALAVSTSQATFQNRKDKDREAELEAGRELSTEELQAIMRK